MDIKGISITIIGCGWLGFPCGKKMFESGFSVRGTTTSKDKFAKLEQHGIEPYLLKLPNDEDINPSLFDVEVLLQNMPPGRLKLDSGENYAKSIEQVLFFAKQSKKLRKIIFISSTSVYESGGISINEENETVPESDSGKAILRAEQLVTESEKPYVILRFGGLAGPGRHPGRFLAGRTGLANGEQPINFLHLDDAIGIIIYMIKHQISNEIFNVVAPQHPSKKVFYNKMAEMINEIPPTFSNEPTNNRRKISVRKLLKKTNFAFIHNDPLNFTFS